MRARLQHGPVRVAANVLFLWEAGSRVRYLTSLSISSNLRSGSVGPPLNSLLLERLELTLKKQKFEFHGTRSMQMATAESKLPRAAFNRVERIMMDIMELGEA